MSERLSRPPVKIKAAQPDGSLNGLHRAAKHFLGPDFGATKFLVVEVGRQELVHKDATGADVAVLEIVRVAMPAAQQDLAAMLQEALDADFEGTIPAFPATDRAKYEAALGKWVKDKGYEPGDVRAAWVDHFGDEVPGPTGAQLEHLVEFVLEVVGPADDEPDAGGEPDGIPANPCQDWSGEVEHGPHTWIAPNDGKSACPGWPPSA